MLAISSSIYSIFSLICLFDCRLDCNSIFFLVAVFSFVAIPFTFLLIAKIVKEIEREMESNKKFLISLVREVEENHNRNED